MSPEGFKLYFIFSRSLWRARAARITGLTNSAVARKKKPPCGDGAANGAAPPRPCCSMVCLECRYDRRTRAGDGGAVIAARNPLGVAARNHRRSASAFSASRFVMPSVNGIRVIDVYSSNLSHTAVDKDLTTGHESAVFGGKEERHSGRLVRASHAS